MPLNRTWLFLAIVPLLMLNAAARAQVSDLLAHGSGDRLWLAEVVQQPEPQGGERTILRTRQTGAGNTQWIELARLNGRVVALANRGNDLVALLDSGDWLIVWSNGRTPGPSLPQGRRILAIASDEHSLYAIGAAPVPNATTLAVTQSELADAQVEEESQLEEASSPATAPTEPWPAEASDAAPDRAALFILERGRWVWRTDLPAQVPLDAAAGVALGVVQSRPVLAVARGAKVLAFEYTVQGTWSDHGEVALREAGPVKVLAAGARPGIWAAGAGGGGDLFVRGETWSKPIPLQPSEPVRQAQARTLASAGGNLRLFFIENARVREQSFTLEGQPIGTVSELNFPRMPSTPESQWPSIALMIALMFILFGTIRRRATLPGGMIDPSKIPLAPLVLRLMAAGIDISPVIITATVIIMRYELTRDPGEILVELPQNLAMIIALVGYVLYTSVSEYFTGRTLGKLIFGLKVAGLDGQRARPFPLILRNVLRLLDLSLGLIIIVLMVFSPLQQRVGDIAAGTVVVLQNPPRDEQEQDQDQDEPQLPDKS
jgi:uncharacterized RDD family membrane protein YckC